eukprot:TRINITY_DN453_c4_g1_i1.p1 TRINITY_DN453_c4_g1~~TRINITY_DN453_c4_g1_i1.p1  ORF type:complete len:158 (+),score=28.93 TRINITY_DN453_c4_g1_i1:64-537(+)
MASPGTSPNQLLEDRVMTEHTFAAGMAQMLEPLAKQHTETIHQVQKSQTELDECIKHLKKKLEDSCQCAQLPQVGAYIQKLNEIKKRTTTVAAKLHQANERLEKTQKYAEAQYGPLKASNDSQQKKAEEWVTPSAPTPPPSNALESSQHADPSADVE